MKILFVASEAYPFVKIGGLGDVAYALPKALRDIGIDVRVIIPKYSSISLNYKRKMEHIAEFGVSVGWRNQYGGLKHIEYNGVPFYFIDNEYYFKREKEYGHYDDGERFSYFSRAILEAINYMNDFQPDIIHCNDWHTAMVPVLLNKYYRNNEKLCNVKTVFTIHNLKYQGVFGKEVLDELLGLPMSYYSEDKMKYYDGVSFMKGGINYSDLITTVSKSYVDEVKMPFYGHGLHGLLNSKGNQFIGILNGIDYSVFNPKKDEDIYFNYDMDNLAMKHKNKTKLQKEFDLPVNAHIPMIGMVSRLVKQKGLDLVSKVIEDILQMDIQMLVLGTGDEMYEDLFSYYSSVYPSKFSAQIRFDSGLAKKIYAGSDMFLMPSLFEPCGIGQLIALRYGTVPIVRETGGLKDTVKPYNKYTTKGTGFTFSNYDAYDMLDAIRRGVGTYEDEKIWQKIMKQAMSQDNSWNNSAMEYKNAYSALL